MSKVAPALCSSFKGVLPTDLLEKYTVEGGWNRLEYDLVILNEIHDQIVASQGDSKGGGNAMEARRKQRRQDLNDGEALQLLKDGGFLPTDKGETL